MSHRLGLEPWTMCLDMYTQLYRWGLGVENMQFPGYQRFRYQGYKRYKDTRIYEMRALNCLSAGWHLHAACQKQKVRQSLPGCLPGRWPGCCCYCFYVFVYLWAFTGYIKPKVSVTARAGEAPTPRLGKPLVGESLPCAGKVNVLSLCCQLTHNLSRWPGCGPGRWPGRWPWPWLVIKPNLRQNNSFLLRNTNYNEVQVVIDGSANNQFLHVHRQFNIGTFDN